MPERVTKEERIISLAIEKARSAKELLHQSLQGNRLPDEKDDRMEKVKVKRPKAEKADKIKNQTRKKIVTGKQNKESEGAWHPIDYGDIF